MKEKKRKVRKARLDADGTAKPLTQISAHHEAGVRVCPGIGAESYVIRDVDPNEKK